MKGKQLVNDSNNIAGNIDKYKPAVPKSVLLFLAGCLWMSIGIMLLFFAASWLLHSANINRYAFAGTGIALAAFVHYFGFRKIADKNIARILPLEEKRCLFSFLTWKTYLIIPAMIALGTILRHSSIPKQYVAILYLGIGFALILSSMRYAKALGAEIRARKSD